MPFAYGMNQHLDVAANRNFSHGFRKSFCSNAGQNLFGLFDPLDHGHKSLQDNCILLLYRIVKSYCVPIVLSSQKI